MKKEIFSVENGSIEVGGHILLKEIYLHAFAGETLGILFNNSEEKTCFLEFLCGKHELYYGNVYYMDVSVSNHEIRTILSQNICVVKNQTSLSMQLTVEENLYLLSQRKFYINHMSYKRQARALLEEFDLSVPLHLPAKNLTSFECIIVEILRAYTYRYKIIVLSHATGALTGSEHETLIQLIEKLKQRGVAFIVIGSMEEFLFSESDTLSIIQGGKTIGNYLAGNFDINHIQRLLQRYYLPSEFDNSKTLEEPLFTVKNCHTGILNNITFTLYKREIVKVIYADEQSAKAFLALLHKSCTKTFPIGFVEENPTHTMLFKNLTILDNLCYPLVSKKSRFWLYRKYRNSITHTLRDYFEKEDFNKSYSDATDELLYKTIYCKWILFRPKALVCINPFSVTDYEINQLISQMLKKMANRGVSVIIVTSFYPYLCNLEGRCYYLENGGLFDNINSHLA